MGYLVLLKFLSKNFWIWEEGYTYITRKFDCALIPQSYAIIAAGEGGRIEKPAIDHSANNAYRVLRNLGFDDDHIFYLNSNRPQDVDGDGDDEIDALASFSNFDNAINEVKDKIEDNPTPFVLFLTGHGFPSQFLFDGSLLWDYQLKGMLEEFPSETRMLIFIDSCYSGSFITSINGISASNRIIITGTHEDQERLWIPYLRSSDRFWGNLNKGLNVKDAFITGAWPGEWWHLWLNDNGDRIGSPPNNLGEDGNLAARTQIGVPCTENLKLTPWIFVWIHSAGELRVYDSQNRVTGLVNGEVKEEIPDSIYDVQDEIVAIFSPSGTHRYEVAGKDEGTYGLSIASIEGAEATTFDATNVSTAPGAIHQYTIDWEALARGEKGVTILIDSDGDGIFEQTIITDNTFQPPIASFTYSPGYPLVEETITFDASSSYDPDGTITKYEWNFDDGNITDTTELLITHYYALAGDYTMNLTVTDDDGATNSASQLITVASASGICVNKTASPTEAEPGTTVTFTINVTNTGDCTLNPVKVVDMLPTGLNYISSYPMASAHDGSVIWNNAGPLALGASKTLTLVAQIGNDAPALLNNTVTVTGTPPVGGNVTASDTAQVIVTRLELEKSGTPGTVAPGGTVTYTIKYSNPGGKDLTNVVITENYPKGMTFISADPAPDADTNNKWTLGTLSAGASGQIIIKMKVPESRDLTFSESGSVTGEGFVMVSKDLSTEQKPYSFKNVVTLSCAELSSVSASASTTVSGVPGTSLELTEHGSGLYSSDEILNLGTKNKSIMLQKSTEAEYQPTSFLFSDGFAVNFATRWMQDICARNMVMGDAMHKKIKDASYIKDETIAEVGGYRTSMEFESSFYGATHIGTVSKSAKTSEDYIGAFEITWAGREECRYLFNWSRVPGNDSEKLIQFLVDVLDIKWAENATITKSVDEMSINITDDGNTATITIDENKETATVKVGGETIYVLEVRIEDDTLNIYDCKLEKMEESVSGIGYVMLDKDLASGQMQVREHGSGLYSSDLNFESGRLDKVTEAEYQSTVFNFSDDYAITFSSKWMQGICSKDKKAGTAIHKKISDAYSMDDDTTATKSSMEFKTSFNGSMHIGARTDGTRISEDYIGVFNITQLIKIGKPAISTPSTPTPDWLPCPFPKPAVSTPTSGLPCPSSDP